jgi:phosphotransferase system HPr-like phosphotransfer protein
MAGISPVGRTGPSDRPNMVRLSHLISAAKGIKFDPFLELKLDPDKEIKDCSRSVIFERSAIVRLEEAGTESRVKLCTAIDLMLKGFENKLTGNKRPTDMLNSYAMELPAMINARADLELAVLSVKLELGGRHVPVPVICAPKLFHVMGMGKYITVFANERWGTAAVEWPHPIRTAILKYQHGIDEEASRILENLCRKFQSRVILRNPQTKQFAFANELDQPKNMEEVQVDKKFINWVVLGLRFKSEVIIEAIGPDADKAILAVERFVESPVEDFI